MEDTAATITATAVGHAAAAPARDPGTIVLAALGALRMATLFPTSG